MKIEGTQTKDYPPRIEITVNDYYWRTVSRGFFFKNVRTLKRCYSLDELENLFRTLEYEYAKNHALKLLSKQGQPSTSLRKKLINKCISEQAINLVINEMQRLNLIDDVQWAESFVRCQLRQKNGPRLIRQKLKAKGLTNQIIDQAINAYTSKTDQQKNIKKLLSTRYAKYNIANHNDKRKVIAALQRKGFDLDCILNTKEISNE